MEFDRDRRAAAASLLAKRCRHALPIVCCATCNKLGASNAPYELQVKRGKLKSDDGKGLQGADDTSPEDRLVRFGATLEAITSRVSGSELLDITPDTREVMKPVHNRRHSKYLDGFLDVLTGEQVEHGEHCLLCSSVVDVITSHYGKVILGEVRTKQEIESAIIRPNYEMDVLQGVKSTSYTQVKTGYLCDGCWRRVDGKYTLTKQDGIEVEVLIYTSLSFPRDRAFYTRPQSAQVSSRVAATEAKAVQEKEIKLPLGVDPRGVHVYEVE